MSSLLFLASVIGFILIAYWAFRNDALGLNENGSGLLAMRDSAPKPKAHPRWQKDMGPSLESPRRLGRIKAAADKKPSWRKTFLYGRHR